MNRSVALLLIVAFALTACAPALAPTVQREGMTDAVIVTLTAGRDVYGASITILGATTNDARCTAVDGDSWCYVADLERGQTVTILATGQFGVACTAAAYVQPGRNIGDYRPFTCRALPAR